MAETANPCGAEVLHILLPARQNHAPDGEFANQRNTSRNQARVFSVIFASAKMCKGLAASYQVSPRKCFVTKRVSPTLTKSTDPTTLKQVSSDRKQAGISANAGVDISAEHRYTPVLVRTVQINNVIPNVVFSFQAPEQGSMSLPR